MSNLVIGILIFVSILMAIFADKVLDLIREGYERLRNSIRPARRRYIDYNEYVAEREEPINMVGNHYMDSNYYFLPNQNYRSYSDYVAHNLNNSLYYNYNRVNVEPIISNEYFEYVKELFLEVEDNYDTKCCFTLNYNEIIITIPFYFSPISGEPKDLVFTANEYKDLSMTIEDIINKIKGFKPYVLYNGSSIVINLTKETGENTNENNVPQ